MKGENFVKVIDSKNGESDIHYFENDGLKGMINLFNIKFHSAKNNLRLDSYHNSMAIGEIMCNMREKINKSISSYEKELL